MGQGLKVYYLYVYFCIYACFGCISRSVGFAGGAMSEENWLARGILADSLPRMSNPRIFRYFKTIPMIIG
jgi:hypothetical protein